jgi:glycosyltransferase involved in cell wall biosynthesis
MTETKISLIIPCFNVEKKLIDRAVLSVKAQDFEDYEVILVDDGSSSDFAKHLKAIEQAADRVKLITIANSGVSTARNIGVQHSSGKYIAFLDADDALVPHFMSRAYQLAEKENADLVIGGVKASKQISSFEAISVDPVQPYQTFTGEQVPLLKKHFIGAHSLVTFHGGYIGRGPVSRLVKADIARQHLFLSNIKIGEDLIWNIDLLSCCQTVVIAPEQWYWYWQNPASATHGYNPQIYQEWLEQLEELEKKLDLNNDELYEPFMDHIYEGIHQIWDCCLRYTGRNRATVQTIKRELYHREPWILLKGDRIKTCKGKKIRFLSMLYKYHLIFLFFDFKKKVGR